MDELPVVVIGAGPQGLAAAAHLAERGVDVVVLERGEGPAAAVSEWGHVRLFSAWPELTDAAARRLLESTGWSAPASGYPTGAEWVNEYLAPLADVLGEQVRYATTVTADARASPSLCTWSTETAMNPAWLHEPSSTPAARGVFRIRRAVMDSPRSAKQGPRLRSRTASLTTSPNSPGRMSSSWAPGTPPRMPCCA